MTIETKLDFKEYRKLMFILAYRKPTTVLMLALGTLMIIASTLYFLGVAIPFFTEPPYFSLAFGLLVVILLPLSIASSARKRFSSGSALHETIVYEFTDDNMLIKGESFGSELSWSKVLKVVELKDWILIYQNRAVANAIPKSSFSSEQLVEFRQLAISKVKGRK